MIPNCEAASGSSVALRINLVILKELNLGIWEMYTARAVYWKKWNGVLYEGV